VADQPRIFSGIRATGDKTLGNYSGGYRQYVTTQEQGEAFFCIVDLHSITTPIEPEELREYTLAGAAMLFATGLDPERSTVFAQSHVVAHAEAAWLLSAATSFGELRRMTQFKEKSEGQDFVSAGLFTYPVLMAGDILLYQADIVPIGDDQRQHLELTRDVAERFNQRYGETFTIPRGVYPEEGARIKNLQEPERLMSTTRGAPQGVVRMVDDPETIRKKFKTAVTDSEKEIRHDPDAKPGISNLLSILAASTGESPEALADRYSQYGPLKKDTAAALIEVLRPIRERYESLAADRGAMTEVLRKGASKAREVAAVTYDRGRSAVGLLES